MAEVSRPARAWPMWRALVEVLGTPARFGGFLAAAAAVTVVYAVLLPFQYTQRVELANLHYLDAYLLTWAILLGMAMGLVLSVQVYAMRKVAAARAAGGVVGGVAFLGSLLPSFLCCTPIIPSVLAFAGASGVGLYTTTGSVQHFFAVHQTEFLAASLALLAALCWWGLRKIGRASCLADGECTTQRASVPGEAALACCDPPSPGCAPDLSAAGPEEAAAVDASGRGVR